MFYVKIIISSKWTSIITSILKVIYMHGYIRKEKKMKCDLISKIYNPDSIFL